jgi:HEAT repeat protein
LAFTRYQHFPTVQKVVEMLCRPKHAALISEILGSAHRSSRRHVARIALDHPGEHRRRVIKCGLASDDGVLRLWSCRAVPSALGGDDLKSILDKLKNDRFMPVRRETLRIRAQHFPASARAIWEGALLDSNAAIREVARYELNKLGSFDAAAFYRNTIANEPANIAGLCGLGEAGDVSDVAMLRSYLTSPTPGHRRAALRGIASLAEEAAVADILRCLDDVSPAVVREAQKNIAPLLYLVDAERLFQLSSGNRPWHVRRTACRLIFELGKWKSLPWLIRLSVHEDQRIAQLAQELAAAWFSFPRATRVFTTLLDAERQAILEAVDATRNRIPIGFLASIEDWLTRG